MQNDYYIVVSKAFFGNKNKAAPPLLFTGKEANLNCRKLSKGRFVVRTGRTIVTVSANMPGLFLLSKEDQRVFYSQAEVIYEKLMDHTDVGLFRKRIPAVFRIRGMQRQSGNG